tara:strand:+ start:163 stop:645 length:483 start_codon:yes stop_codon:yes gene_type:complete
MAYKQNAGRGPMQKTGAGIPSALLQTDPKDEKSGKNLGAYNSSMSAPTPTLSGEASTDSFVSTRYAKDVKDDKTINTNNENAYQKVKAVKGGTFNLGGTKGKKQIVNVENVDDKGGFNYQNPKTGKRGHVTRAAAKESSGTGYSIGAINEAIKRRLNKKQ